MAGSAASSTCSALAVATSSVDAPGAALLHVRVQALDDLGVLGVGRRDQQPVEGPLLEPHEHGLGDLVEVVLGVLLDRALVAVLGQAALAHAGPGAPGLAVVDVADLVQLPLRAREQPPVAAVDEQHRPARGRADLGQRRDQRRVVDRDQARRRARQPQHLEQARRAAREQGEALRALGREVALEPVPYAVDVGAQLDLAVVGQRGVVGARLALGLVDDRADLGLARLAGGEPARVEVEVDVSTRWPSGARAAASARRRSLVISSTCPAIRRERRRARARGPRTRSRRRRSRPRAAARPACPSRACRARRA